jgi:hypothetical protein
MAIPGRATHREELLVQAGIKPLEVIKIATYNCGLFLGREEDFGSIRAGRYADLVLLNADATVDIDNTENIAFVMKNGQIIDEAKLPLPGRQGRDPARCEVERRFPFHSVIPGLVPGIHPSVALKHSVSALREPARGPVRSAGSGQALARPFGACATMDPRNKSGDDGIKWKALPTSIPRTRRCYRPGR